MLVELKKGDVLLLNLVLDDLAVEEAFEALEELELSDNSVTVIERLGDNGGKSGSRALIA
jgi:hypothetical protein